jgi:hypothetical protein
VHAASKARYLIVGAPRIRHVPGRKTDVKDAEWIADLVRLSAGQLRRRPTSAMQGAGRQSGHRAQPHPRSGAPASLAG